MATTEWGGVPPQGLAGWLEYIQCQHFRTIDLQLDPVATVWRRLGIARPPFVFTVAGTNGKGSCVAMLEAVLIAAGHHTGSYTSPHLVRYNERIRIDGVPATDDEIVYAFQCIEAVREEIGLTYFEFGTLCALQVFASHAIEVAVLEVGMGGRLDAVNVIENDLALITSIGLDHQRWLGSDREQIGREKAGIIKPGKLVVNADPLPPATIAVMAMERNATLLQDGKDYCMTSEPDGECGCWWSDHPAVPHHWRRIAGVPQCLPGHWQIHNLGGVVAALALTSSVTEVTPEHLVSGLAEARLPGRCEVVGYDPLTILDVAHNADSAAALACFLDAHTVPGKTHAVFGLLADKALEEVLQEMVKRVDHWHLAGIADERGQSSETLAKKMSFRLPGVKIGTYPDAVRAYQGARHWAGPNDRVVAFGSFFIVGDIIASLAKDRTLQ